MCMTDDAMAKLADAMREKFGAGIDFELALGELVGRYRRAHDAAMRDQEAARLLPLGAEVVAIRQQCHKATVYRRASRAKSVARIAPVATGMP